MGSSRVKVSQGQIINVNICKIVACFVLAVSKSEPVSSVRVVLQMTRYVAVYLLLLGITTSPMKSTWHLSGRDIYPKFVYRRKIWMFTLWPPTGIRMSNIGYVLRIPILNGQINWVTKSYSSFRPTENSILDKKDGFAIAWIWNQKTNRRLHQTRIETGLSWTILNWLVHSIPWTPQSILSLISLFILLQ